MTIAPFNQPRLLGTKAAPVNKTVGLDRRQTKRIARKMPRYVLHEDGGGIQLTPTGKSVISNVSFEGFRRICSKFIILLLLVRRHKDRQLDTNQHAEQGSNNVNDVMIVVTQL